MNHFRKDHPRNTCPRCHKPNYQPNTSIPENAGARDGLTINASLCLPDYWKANGGPGILTETARLCRTCGLLLLELLTGGGFLPVEAFALRVARDRGAKKPHSPPEPASGSARSQAS